MKKKNRPTIIFLEGQVNYTMVYYVDGSNELSSYTLLKYQIRFPSFKRISRSFLVNPEYIREISEVGNDVFVVLKNNKSIKVPRRRIKVLDENLKS